MTWKLTTEPLRSYNDPIPCPRKWARTKKGRRRFERSKLYRRAMMRWWKQIGEDILREIARERERTGHQALSRLNDAGRAWGAW